MHAEESLIIENLIAIIVRYEFVLTVVSKVIIKASKNIMMVNECLAVTELYHITGKVGGDNIW
jgi:hypothetical protein